MIDMKKFKDMEDDELLKAFNNTSTFSPVDQEVLVRIFTSLRRNTVISLGEAPYVLWQSGGRRDWDSRQQEWRKLEDA